jgi:hypothetical protein
VKVKSAVVKSFIEGLKKKKRASRKSASFTTHYHAGLSTPNFKVTSKEGNLLAQQLFANRTFETLGGSMYFIEKPLHKCSYVRALIHALLGEPIKMHSVWSGLQHRKHKFTYSKQF